ncbi:hypothetical protein SDC9_84519 [bioreactor metagenome]|uniref:Uncharacterized protein n=1 Tax=bioreactor metagenome TaxID=1076179 RepID=A0A644ZB16_9ZZZZ
MHIGKQEGDPRGQDNRRGENGPVAQLFAFLKEVVKDEENQEKGGRNPKNRDQVDVHRHFVRDKGVDRRGVIVERAGIGAGLFRIDPQGIRQGLAQRERGYDGGGVGNREEQQMAEFDPPGKPQNAPERNEKHGLQFEGKGRGQKDEGRIRFF